MTRAEIEIIRMYVADCQHTLRTMGAPSNHVEEVTMRGLKEDVRELNATLPDEWK